MKDDVERKRRTFYRVASRAPLSKPTLTLGPPSHDPNAGYVQTYSEVVASKMKVKKMLRAARKAYPFAKHSIDVIELEPGMEILVEGKLRRVRVPRPARGSGPPPAAAAD